LFGTFFELLVSEDGTLFDETLRPTFHGNEGVRALSILKKWYQDGLTPSALPEMHFDEVSANFRDGDSSMVTDWPGYYGLLQHSSVSGRYGAALTPASDAGKRAVYGGSHAFAIPAAARHPEASARLLKYLTSEEVQAIDAGSGHVPVRPGLLSKLKDEAGAGTLEAQRWALLEETIATSVVIPPKFATYPEAEDRLWQALRQCILGKWDEQTALRTAATDMIRIISEG
jgi:ABC-type glycerol-3-phosphate transport system substrate-binding protein